MKFICSLITVEDISRSRYFYENVLHQKVKYDYSENILFHGDFAIHQRSHFQGLINNKKILLQSNSFELYFEYDDLEKTVKDLKANQVEFIHGICEQPWKQRVVRFYDPDKNIIEIGESMEYLAFRLSEEKMPVMEISKTINMPEDFIHKAIAKFK